MLWLYLSKPERGKNIRSWGGDKYREKIVYMTPIAII